jgi:hypothetical protein
MLELTSAEITGLVIIAVVALVVAAFAIAITENAHAKKERSTHRKAGV